jgi:hypothetical protein
MTVALLSINLNDRYSINHVFEDEAAIESVRRQVAKEVKTTGVKTKKVVTDERGEVHTTVGAVVDHVCRHGMSEQEDQEYAMQRMALWTMHFVLELSVPPEHVMEGLSVPVGEEIKIRDILLAAFRDRLAEAHIRVRIEAQRGGLGIEVSGQGLMEVTKH